MVDEAKTHKTFLKDIVEQVQIHHHTKSCYKKGKGCRYGFPKLPSNRTIIAQPIQEENMSKFKRKNPFPLQPYNSIKHRNKHKCNPNT